MIPWFLNLFQAYRQLEREVDDAKREAGHWRSEAAKWEARCETAREELMEELRAKPPEDAPTVELPPVDPADSKPMTQKEQGRKRVKRREAEFFAHQLSKMNGNRD